MESMTRAWVWYWGGKMSMIREIVSGAEFVWRVEKVRCPGAGAPRGAPTGNK
jgi:hypothetical protein